MSKRDQNPQQPFDADHEFDNLRDLWRQSEPTSGRGAELELEDEATRASVEQLRAAWGAIASATTAATPTLPAKTSLEADQRAERFVRIAQARTRTNRSLPNKHRFALAAAALVLFAVGLRLQSKIRTSNPIRNWVAINKNTTAEGVLSPLREQPSATPSTHFTVPSSQIEVTPDNQLVLRSGSVRLYLPMAPSPAGSSNSIPFDTQLPETHSR